MQQILDRLDMIIELLSERKRQEQPEVHSAIVEALRAHLEASGWPVYIGVGELGERLPSVSHNTIGRTLTQLGYTRCRITAGGRRAWKYRKSVLHGGAAQ